ncbi:hypothetical protein O6R05_08110 [Peptoniphilus equinus]|uniref:Copper amine oxidase-like N-terminal domain-containing protein n=1 Tax=Peptoniphilus equinus TaxID=3016343 RepID=A0ABY7QT35_9FIRM|nr:hypothetical protein [Peptoniphilus equinus]WBW49955.1 hypothetical protein O6R05_08110 [Peptoniphilus equinus]
MKKLLVSALLVLALGSRVHAADVQVSKQAVHLDGSPVRISGYNIDGENYFKLRDVAAVLKDTSVHFNVTFDSNANLIFIDTETSYTPSGQDASDSLHDPDSIVPSSQLAVVNGEKTKYTGYLIDGNNFFRLRDLGRTLGFWVSYDEASDTVLLKDEALPKKPIITKTDVTIINLESALHQNTKTFSIGDGTTFDFYDFIQDSSIIGVLNDGNQLVVDAYLKDGAMIVSPLHIKYRGNLSVTPKLKVSQSGNDTVMTFPSTALDDATLGIDSTQPFTLTLGVMEGDTFKALSVIDVTAPNTEAAR